MRNNPLKSTDPTGPAADPGGAWDIPSPRVGPPPWDNLAPLDMLWRGSRESLYFHAWSYGLTPGQNPGQPSIDDLFDPFYLVNPLTSADRSYEFLLRARPTGEALYEPYGGLGNLRNTIMNQCASDHCNNPLNYEYHPIGRINDVDSGADPLQAAAMIVDTTWNLPGSLFLQALPDEPCYEVNQCGWNYERFWLSGLMVQYPEALLKAQWEFLDIYRQSPGDPNVVPDYADLVE